MHEPQRAFLARPFHLVAAATIGLAAAACEPHSEVVVVAPAPPPILVLHEVEPNDTPLWPMAIGPLVAGDQLVILGHASSWSDPYDGFAFVAHGPLLVDFQLLPSAGWGDLDLLVYDPYLEATVGVWAQPGSHENGAILVPAGAEFHLVVSAYAGSQSYELHVQASPWYHASLPGAFEDDDEARRITAFEGSSPQAAAGESEDEAARRAFHARYAEGEGAAEATIAWLARFGLALSEKR